MRQTSQPRSATSAAIAGSPRSAVTSLTMLAPASSAAAATAAFDVSIDSRAPAPASPSSTGTTRRSSSASLTGSAPGRVDSPPMSRIAAPCATSARPWAIAASGSSHSPPSENESGVTLTTPMTTGSGRWAAIVPGRYRPRRGGARATAWRRAAACRRRSSCRYATISACAAAVCGAVGPLAVRRAVLHVGHDAGERLARAVVHVRRHGVDAQQRRHVEARALAVAVVIEAERDRRLLRDAVDERGRRQLGRADVRAERVARAEHAEVEGPDVAQEARQELGADRRDPGRRGGRRLGRQLGRRGRRDEVLDAQRERRAEVAARAAGGLEQPAPLRDLGGGHAAAGQPVRRVRRLRRAHREAHPLVERVERGDRPRCCRAG